MSSIPLPALAVRPPQMPDPVEQAGNLMRLKSLAGEQQLQQEQLKGAQMQNQMGQMDLQSRQAITKAYADSGGDLDKFQSLAGQYGASPKDLIQLNKEMVDLKTKYAGLDEATLKAQKEKNAQLSPMLESVLNAPQEDRAALWTLSVNKAARGGLLKPEEAQQYQQYPGDDQAKMFLNQHKTEEQLIAGAEEGRKQDEYNLKRPGVIADTQTKQADAVIKNAEAQRIQSGALPKELALQQYQGILNKLQNKQPVSPAEMNWARAYEFSERKTTTSSDSLGITSSNTSGPSGLSAFTGGSKSGSGAPNSKDSLVDMVGQYKLNPSILQRLSVKHPDIIAAVGQKYPDWDQTNYMAKNKAMQSFTSGPYSRQINATNIALDHLGVLGDAIDGLKNSDLRVLNRIANSYGLQTGNSAVTVFNTIAHKLAPELAQAYIQGGGGEGERGQIQRDYDASLGPDQLKSNLAVTARLLQPNIETLQQQYKNTIGRDDFQQRFLTPGAQKSMAKLTGNQASPSDGKTAVGPNGHKIVVRGGKWVDAQTGAPI